PGTKWSRDFVGCLVGVGGSNSEMLSQNIPLKGRTDFRQSSRIPTAETIRAATSGCGRVQRLRSVADMEYAAHAAQSASRAFEALYGCPWKLHADSIEVIDADSQ